MRIRNKILVLLFFLGMLFLVACLGELTFPTLETTPVASIAAPPVDPTIAVAPRISLDFAEQPPAYSQSLPQISHDLIGRSDCLMCHKQGVSGAPRIPDTHRGLESSACQTCHSAPSGAALSGAEMYARVCARCHGESGEGGFGTVLNDKIYLSNVTDDELRTVIMQGRGGSEMLSWGDLGLLVERQIDELVSMIRSWETTAAEIVTPKATVLANAAQGDPEQGELFFAQFCTGCHGFIGEIAVGEKFILSEAVTSMDDAALARGIRDGTDEMPSFHALFTTDDINDILALLRSWGGVAVVTTPTPTALGEDETLVSGTPAVPSFTSDVLPIFETNCSICHGTMGGWDASSYETIMNSGDNAPVVIPENVEESLLAQKILGTHTEGDIMPPSGKMLAEEIQIVLNWIAAGAPAD